MVLMELFREIDEASTSIDNAFSVLYAFFVIFGALECFFGYKLFRIMTAIVGFLVGGLIGAMVCAILVGEPAGAFFGFLVFGALGSWLSFKLYKLAIFVLCFLLGGILGLGLGLMSGDMEAAPLLIVLLGILLGVLGVVLTKPVIIISSALGGGISIGASLDAFLGGDGVGVYIGLLIGVLGIFLQFWMDQENATGRGQRSENLTAAGISENVRGRFSKTAFSKSFGEKSAQLSSGTKILFSNVREQLLPTPTTTRSPHKCEGYQILAKGNAPFWEEDLPIVVTEVYIASRPNAAVPMLLFGLQNVGDQTVTALALGFRCFNSFQEELRPVEKLVVQDITLRPGEVWFSDTPYTLPDNDTRRVDVIVRTIATGDGCIWNNEAETYLEPLPEQALLRLPRELADELSRLGADNKSRYNLRNIFLYQPQDHGTYWDCACGQLNTRETCLACALEKDSVFEWTQLDFLQQRRELRLAEERRLEKERREKLAEQAQEIRTSAEKMARKSVESAQNGYKKSAAYVKRAVRRLEASLESVEAKAYGFYRQKIWANRKKILLISGSLAAVALAVAGVAYGVPKYEEYRRRQEELRVAEERAALEREQELERERQREEMNQALRLDYEGIIEDSTLYDGLTAGLIYADYMDMNQDGIEELLLLSASNGRLDENNTITVQVYTGLDGKAFSSGEITLNLEGGMAESKISLYQKGNSLSICRYLREDGSMSSTSIAYYAVGRYSTTLENQLFSWFDWVPGEERKDTLYSPENFEEIMAQYTWVTDLFTFHDFDGASFDRGILPEPEVTPDVQRRIALLDILDGQQNLKYAKLIDLNQDGQEDLLTLYSSNLPGETWVCGYRFRAYVWDGQQVQEINLAQTGDAEIDVHLKFWPGPQCALYQKMDGGQIYVCYDGEIAGGWGGTLFVNSLDPADYEFCSYPAMAGSDYSPDQYTEEENMELQEGYARQEEAYNAVMARYQFMEYAHVESPYNLESESAYEEIVSQLKKTVQMVIQQLQNGERSAATENTAPM